MRIHLLLIPFAASFLGIASAETSVPIFNPGFDADQLNCTPSAYCYEQGGISGWFVGPQSGIIKPGTAQFPKGVPGGTNVAYLGGGGAPGSLLQMLSATVQANTTYTLRLYIGHRLDEAFTGYLAVLQAGVVPLASGSGLSPAAGKFLEEVIVYTTDANPIQLGQKLTIRIQSLGTGQAEIAAVSLTVQ